MNNTLPIGVFDSGMGGLTVLRALMAAMPNEDMLYLGDTARLPYGTKSSGTVTKYAMQAAGALVERGVKMLVIACNTATAAALPALRAQWPHLPVFGVIEPGAKAACAASKTGRIAVMATESTIKNGAYQKAIEAMNPQALVTNIPCSLLVHLAEEGWLDGPVVEGAIHRYIDGVFGSGRERQPDCLVLGCTHFPALAASIASVAGPDVAIVDSAETTTAEVAACLSRHPELRGDMQPGSLQLLTTDDPERFARVGSIFLNRSLDAGQVELVNL